MLLRDLACLFLSGLSSALTAIIAPDKIAEYIMTLYRIWHVIQLLKATTPHWAQTKMKYMQVLLIKEALSKCYMTITICKYTIKACT